MTVKQLIKNWCVGNHSEKVPPLEFLDEKYVRHIGAGKNKLRRMNCMLQGIESIERV